MITLMACALHDILFQDQTNPSENPVYYTLLIAASCSCFETKKQVWLIDTTHNKTLVIMSKVWLVARPWVDVMILSFYHYLL